MDSKQKDNDNEDFERDEHGNRIFKPNEVVWLEILGNKVPMVMRNTNPAQILEFPMRYFGVIRD
jgi:hypothetical protein